MPRLLPRIAPAEAAPTIADQRREGRFVHPWAWWGWALSASAAVSLTTNPLVIACLAAAVVVVVLRRRPDTPWARSLKIYLMIGAFIVGMRLFFQIVIGGVRSGPVLFTLPSVQLPAWAAGITLGGPVTVDGLAFAFFDALRLAVMLLCVGAANSLANPRTALKSVPAALRDISTAVVIALGLIPQLIASVHRVRRGQRLRGGRRRGLAAVPGTLIPVIEDSVEGSLLLASSMEARGYGRTRRADEPRRGTWQLIVALVLIVGGIYALLGVPTTSATALGLSPATLVALTLLLVGLALTVWGMRVAGRQLGVTVYRPAPWGGPEVLTLVCGVATLAIFLWLSSAQGAALSPSTSPLTWPTLPPLAALAAVVLVVPGFVTPDPKVPA